MCTAAMQDYLPSLGAARKDEEEAKQPLTAVDVPLGSGLAEQARLSILGRREQIRRAVEGD